VKSFIVLIAIAIGFAFPQAHIFGWLIRPLLMFLLFSAFLDIHLDRSLVNIRVIVGPLAALAIGMVFYFLVLPFDRTMAVTAFVMAVGPTATAAPAMVMLLRGHMEYITGAILFSSLTAAVLLPFSVPFLTGTEGRADGVSMLMSVAPVILVPLLAGQALKHLSHTGYLYAMKHRYVSLYVLAVMVFLAVAQASQFIRTSPEIGAGHIVRTALLAAVICAVSFLVGRVLGGKRFALESSQAIGNKNSMLVMWFALQYVSPLVAVGPVCYVVCDSLYNSYLLYKDGLSQRSANNQSRKKARS
jgi:BASS family bile acid:Na+ symporter